MSEPNNIKKALLLKQINQRLELLALRLEVHGCEAATPRLVSQLARSPAALELQNLLRSHGFSPTEIAELMNVHPPGCACWQCVIAVNAAVRRRPSRWRKTRLRLDR